MTNENPIKMEIWPDKMRGADRRALLQLHGLESRTVDKVIPINKDTRLVRFEVRDEIFVWNGDPMFPDGRTFNVRKIKDAIVRHRINSQVIRVAITEEMYQFTLQNIEPERIDKVTDDDMKRLGVAVFMPSDSVLLIDGNHRLVARWRKGLRDIRVAIVDFEEVDQFTWLPGGQPCLG